MEKKTKFTIVLTKHKGNRKLGVSVKYFTTMFFKVKNGLEIYLMEYELSILDYVITMNQPGHFQMSSS